MKILRTFADIPHSWGGRAGLVPTMGAFHEGHLQLMRKAKAENDYCVVSLFVNPTQFGPNEDYTKYPRNEKQDFELAEAAGADFIFTPSAEEMYRRKTTQVIVEGITERWEGEHRPGHFAGVATVVLKLFNLLSADTAHFGFKDLQQCAVIKRMVDDLNIPIGLRFIETIREPDGLAMSSRNVYLSVEERRQAPTLFRTLTDLSTRLRHGQQVDLEAAKAQIEREGFQVQYLALVDADTLEPLAIPQHTCRLIVASYLGKTRLIDNVAVL